MPDRDLTPEEVADLKDMAARYRARRSRDSTGAAVRRHDWSPEQARLNGLRNSEKSLRHFLSGGPNADLQAKLDEVLAGIAALEAQGVKVA